MAIHRLADVGSRQLLMLRTVRPPAEVVGSSTLAQGRDKNQGKFDVVCMCWLQSVWFIWLSCFLLLWSWTPDQCMCNYSSRILLDLLPRLPWQPQYIFTLLTKSDLHAPLWILKHSGILSSYLLRLSFNPEVTVHSSPVHRKDKESSRLKRELESSERLNEWVSIW